MTKRNIMKKTKDVLFHLPYGDVIINCFFGKYYTTLIKSDEMSTGGSCDARYCYSVWMRHLINYYNESGKIPSTVVEFGPGDSIGTGIAALLSGCDQYYALDFIKYSGMKNVMNIYEQMITLFKNHTDIPDDREYPKIRPKLESYKFPDHIISPEVIDKNLSDERLEVIRESLNNLSNDHKISNNNMISYLAPWENTTLPEINPELIFSQAVLEHIDNLENAYSVMASISVKETYMSHDIDFKSHGCSKYWNGHWSYSDSLWQTIRGTRPYFINREPLSTHLKLFSKNGFKIIKCIQDNEGFGSSSISRKKLKGRFTTLSDDDFQTSSAYILAKYNE